MSFMEYAQAMKVACIALATVPFTLDAALAGDVTVRFATIQNPQYELSQETDAVLKEIEQKTEGRVKFQPLYGTESGFQSKQYISALELGMLDAATISTSASALEFPWLNIYGLPFFAADGESRARMVQATKPQAVEFAAEHNFVAVAMPLRADPYLVIYAKKDLSKLEDFKGQLIRVYDPATNKIVSSVGGVPTSLQKGEVYMGLQRGTIDGAITGVTDAEGMKLDEVSKYVLQLDVNLLPNIVGFSRKVWDKISAPDQAIIQKTFADWEADYTNRTIHPDAGKDPYAYIRAHGMQVVLPDAATKAIFDKIRDEAVAAYVAQDDSSAKAYDSVMQAAKAQSN